MAVQRIWIGDASSYEYEWLLMDLDALANLNSPYLLHYYGALLREGEVWLCMELVRASLHDLWGRAYGTPGRRMPEEVLQEIAIALVHGLHHLNRIQLKTCETDVQSSDIFVDDKGNFKLGVAFGFEPWIFGNVTLQMSGLSIGPVGLTMVRIKLFTCLYPARFMKLD